MPTDSKVPAPKNTFLSNTKIIHIIPKTKIFKRYLQRRFRKRHKILRSPIKQFYGHRVRGSELLLLFFSGSVYTFFHRSLHMQSINIYLSQFLCLPLVSLFSSSETCFRKTNKSIALINKARSIMCHAAHTHQIRKTSI